MVPVNAHVSLGVVGLDPFAVSFMKGRDSLMVKPARWREGVNFQAMIARFSTAKLLLAAPPLFSIIIA